MYSARSALRTIGLILGVASLACGKTPLGPPNQATIEFTSPLPNAQLTSADNQDPSAPAGSIGITVSGSATGVSVGSAVTLTVDGNSQNALESTIQPGLSVSFPNVLLTGSPSGTPHALALMVNDSGGTGPASANLSVVVSLGTTGCALVVAPVTGTLFNETGNPVPGFPAVVQDTDLATPGMQATLTVTGTGSSCIDGTSVTLTITGGSTQSAPLSAGQATFTSLTLPDTPIGALGDASQRLVVTASAAGLTSGSASYVVDSTIPTAVILMPVAGATFGDSQDVDPTTPGLQINVSGTTNGFGPQLAAGLTVSFTIAGLTMPLGPATLKSDGTFITEVTLNNGMTSLVFTATGNTGNVTTSVPVQVTANATPVISITKPLEGAVLDKAENQIPTSPEMNTTVGMSTTATPGVNVDVCSTVANSAGVIHNGVPPGYTGPPLYEVGSTTANGPSTTLFPAPLGEGAQALYATVTDGTTVWSPPVNIVVHTTIPIVTSITVNNAFDGGAEQWLNQSNLDAGLAWTTVLVTLDPSDVFVLDGGSPSQLSIVNITNGASNSVGKAPVLGTAPPQALVPISLLDGPYMLQAQVADPYGNTNDLTLPSNPANFDLFAKVSLPGCSIVVPQGPYFNVADNGGVDNAGNVNLPVTLTTTFVSAPNLSGFPTIPGEASVAVDGTSVAQATVAQPNVSAPTSTAQGQRVLTAQVTDPAGNPSESCSNSVTLTVATVTPTLVITAVNPDGTNAIGPYFNGRDAGISIASTDAEALQPLTITANGTQFAVLPLTPPTTATTLSNLPNGTNNLVATVTDLAGNVGDSGPYPIDIISSGCSLVVTMPQTNPAFFNGTGAVAGVVNANVQFYTPDCDGGAVTFSNTLDGGTTGTTVLTTSATTGLVNFTLNLTDGEQGSFFATIAGGQATPTIFYQAKFTPPTVGGFAPDSGSVWVVAQSGNPNVGSIVDAGNLVVANEFTDQSEAQTDFQVTGLGNLGPVDSANHVGTASLQVAVGVTNTTYGPFFINPGQTTVDFPNALLPPHASGNVTVTVEDSALNTTTQTWAVLTDVIPPGAPAITASTVNARAASFNLAWNATADDNTSGGPVAGYVLGWSTTISPASDAQFDQMTQVLGIDGGQMVNSPQTYVLSGLPTFNSFFLELRAVDAVGNRSALTPASTVITISDGGTPNTLQVATITGPAGVRFGYRLASGDIKWDSLTDMAIAAPPLTGLGAVYIAPGNADLTKWNQAIGLIPSEISLTAGPDAGTDLFGYSLAVGDFNGDGTDDLAIGAPTYASGQGLVNLYFGSAAGLPAAPSVSILGNVLDQGGTNKNFGAMVASVGHVGDGGVGDTLLIGAPFEGVSGISYLFVGRTTANWAAINSYMQADTIFTSASGDNLGFRFGAVPLGDINNDGVPDFTVPASQVSTLYLVGGATLQSGTQSLVSAGGSLGTLVESNCTAAGVTIGTCFGGTALGNVPLAVGGSSLIVAESALSQFYIFDFTPTDLNPTPIIITPQLPAGQPAYLGWSMAQSDINGDGRPDLLMGTQDNVSPTGVYFFVNSGTSPYFQQNASANLVQPLASYFGFAVAAGDFNGLGPQDVAASDPFGLSDVWIYY